MKPTHLAGASLAVLVLATGAEAAVTPEQAWADWQAMFDRWGQTVTTDGASREGDTLVVRNLRTVATHEGTRTETRIDRLSLRDMGDGRVEITTAPVTRIESVTTPPAEATETGPTRVRLEMTEEGARTLASGDPGAIRYDYTAPSVTLRTLDVTDSEGETLPFQATVAASAVSARWEGTAATTGSADADSLRLRFEGNTPGAEGAPGASQTLERTLDTVSFEMQGQPTGATVPFLGQWSAAYASSDWTLDVTEDGRRISGNGTSGAGTLSGNTSEGRQALDGTETDTAFHLEIPDLAAPIDGKAEQSVWSLAVPTDLGQGDAPFDVALDLHEATASDATWALFDPRRQLPRDPVRLGVKLSGLVGPNADDPSQFDIRSVELHDLQLDAVGARLTADGQASFAPQAPAVPGVKTGPVAPALERGVVNLTLRGGAGLIDALAAAGLIPQQQALGARMMLGMFGRPVEGQPDTVASTIEMGGGGLTVNGQRLQ